MTRRYGWLLILLLAAPWLLTQSQVYSIPVKLPSGGVYSVVASAVYNDELITGYGMAAGEARMAGMAVCQYRSGGVLVTEMAGTWHHQNHPRQLQRVGDIQQD
jgi:hypothetical protein